LKKNKSGKKRKKKIKINLKKNEIMQRSKEKFKNLTFIKYHYLGDKNDFNTLPSDHNYAKNCLSEILEERKKKIKNFIFYSDGCGGQFKCKQHLFFLSTYLDIKITAKFFGSYVNFFYFIFYFCFFFFIYFLFFIFYLFFIIFFLFFIFIFFIKAWSQPS
jgi:hypothetical protein